MSTRVTRKRARPDAGPDEGQPEKTITDVAVDDAASIALALSRDTEFWFDDGTIILDSGDVEFRVYRGHLASHSPVLKEMFAKPHGSRSVPAGDGSESVICPYIRLSDSPQELRHVLRVFMAGSGKSGYVNCDCTIHMISAYIRLGQKYQMTSLYEEALQFLRNFFSDDFNVWDSSYDWVSSGWEDIHAIGVVNLARLTGASSILPTALLVCVAAPDINVVHGFPRGDGSQENLTLDDLGLCYCAISTLREGSVAAIMNTFSAVPPSPDCKSSNICKARLASALQGLRPLDLIRDNPFISYDEIKSDKDLGLCRRCLKMIAEKNDKERRSVWNRLPELLGIKIPGWGEAAQRPVPSE
ncbi:hypothetical protein K466DRAFT_489580 [Polyporus arcularius HHB13444]|uniref:BTB domain-containing protein n=1 Tax=Polyporus arcularius HHB13444 TaxID=1314778 RepID=A0A5C3PEE3_9APHY|nr:hypothetical protein K466DRAFT_489580 [Polyporus arcularius HHB13444]